MLTITVLSTNKSHRGYYILKTASFEFQMIQSVVQRYPILVKIYSVVNKLHTQDRVEVWGFGRSEKTVTQAQEHLGSIDPQSTTGGGRKINVWT